MRILIPAQPPRRIHLTAVELALESSVLVLSRYFGDPLQEAFMRRVHFTSDTVYAHESLFATGLTPGVPLEGGQARTIDYERSRSPCAT